MLRYIAINFASSSSTVAASMASSGNWRERTLISSPTVNLSNREYTLAIQTKSFKEIWDKIHIPREEIKNQISQHRPQILRPNRERVEEALDAMPNTTLKHLVSSYFTYSETTTDGCLDLQHNVDRAIINYADVQDLIKKIPIDVDSLDESQCDSAHKIFSNYFNLENPFPNSEHHNFCEVCLCLSKLKQQLDRLTKLDRLIKLARRANVGIAQFFIALLCPPQPRFAKKEISPMAQLDAVYKGIYVLKNDLDTIDRLVASLYSAVEGDKNLIQIGLCGEERDKHSIFEVLKQLRKSQVNFLQQLEDLEIHICHCCDNVNKTRSLLLQKIC